MRRLSALLAVAVALTFAPLTAAQDKQPPEIKVQVVELQIRRQSPKDLNFDPSDMVAYCRIQFGFTLPDAHVLELDVKSSKLISAKDDKGTDLTKTEAKKVPPWLSDFSLRVNRLGNSALVGMHFPAPPAPGATKLSLKASLAVVVGKDGKTEEKKDIALGETAVSVGMFKVGRPKDVKPFANITPVETSGPVTAYIWSVQFLDDKGNELRTFLALKGRVGKDKDLRFAIEYNVTDLPEKFAVRIHYFPKLQTITVPVDVETGLSP